MVDEVVAIEGDVVVALLVLLVVVIYATQFKMLCVNIIAEMDSRAGLEFLSRGYTVVALALNARSLC